MFATQQYMDVTPDLGRKRLRDDDEAVLASASFSEHRNKRLQSLPLRTSPRTSQQWLPSTTLTPLNAYPGDDSVPRSHFSPWSSSPPMGSSQPGAEMDMMDTVHSPTSLQTEPTSASSRIPTPMQPSFAAQVKGQQHGEWTGSGPAVTPLNGIVNMGHHGTGFAHGQAVPRTAAAESEWQALQSHRRLPSPISEGDDSALGQSVGSPGMMVDDSDAQSQLSTMQPSPPEHDMEHPNAMMEAGCQHQQGAESDEEASSPSPNRRGHIRSRHTINNWTWQPGMKKSFSIGYRSDCDKCRLKVPGHFNHIIIS